jgi:hypothetical protein
MMRFCAATTAGGRPIAFFTNLMLRCSHRWRGASPTAAWRGGDKAVVAESDTAMHWRKPPRHEGMQPCTNDPDQAPHTVLTWASSGWETAFESSCADWADSWAGTGYSSCAGTSWASSNLTDSKTSNSILGRPMQHKWAPKVASWHIGSQSFGATKVLRQNTRF